MNTRSKIFTTHLLILHLIFAPVLSSQVFANESGNPQVPGPVQESQGPRGPDFNANDFTGLIQGVGDQIMRGRQQSLNAAQQASMLSGLRPETGPSEMFPQCQLPKSESKFPKNACQQMPQNEQHRRMQETYQSAAVQYGQFFDRMLDTATNRRSAVGLKCLEDAKENTELNLNQQIRSLQALRDAVKKQNQKFRDDAQKVLDEIQKSHGLLHGGAGSEDIDARSVNLADLFSPECRNILTNQTNGSSSQGLERVIRTAGLLGNKGDNGVRALATNVRDKGNNFKSSKNKILNDIDQYINSIQDEIRESGVDGLASGGDLTRALNQTGLTDFGGGQNSLGRIGSEVQDRYTELVEYKQEVQQHINKSDLDYRIPDMDTVFDLNFKEFEANAKTFFKKQYVHNCVTGEADTGIGLTADQIMNGLRVYNVSNDDYIVKNYREALNNILNDDTHIQDKMAEIRSLDSKFGNNVKLRYKDRHSGKQVRTPYEYYKTYVNACVQSYDQNESLDKNDRGLSQKAKVNRIADRLKELRKRHKNFTSNLANDISEALISCNGSELSNSVGSCSEDVFEPSSNKFCVEHAEQCANRANQCYQQVDGLVTQQKQKIKNQSQIFNQQVESFVARQEQLLQNVKGRLEQTQRALSQFFGSDFELAEELFVSMPEMKDTKMLGNNLGVKLRGGGEEFIQNLDRLPNKIDQLAKKFEKQKDLTLRKIDEHIAKQRQSIKANKRKWVGSDGNGGLFNRCRDRIAAYDQKKLDEFAKRKEEFNERASKVGQFCHEYALLDHFRDHPTAACDGQIDSLMDGVRGTGDMEGVPQHLTKETKQVVINWKIMCATSQSETPDGDADGPEIERLCKDDEFENIDMDVSDGNRVKRKLLEACKKNQECLDELESKNLITRAPASSSRSSSNNSKEIEKAKDEKKNLEDELEKLEEKLTTQKQELDELTREDGFGFHEKSNPGKEIGKLEKQIAKKKSKLESLGDNISELEDTAGETPSSPPPSGDDYQVNKREDIKFCEIKNLELGVLKIVDESFDSNYYEKDLDRLDVTSLANDMLEDAMKQNRQDDKSQARAMVAKVGEIQSNSSCQAMAKDPRRNGGDFQDLFDGKRGPAQMPGLFK